MSKADSEYGGREKEMAELLAAYRVPFPQEETVQNTVDVLRQYVPQKPVKFRARFYRLSGLLKSAAISVSIMRVSYWVLSIFLYAAGYIATVSTYSSPYKLMLILAPLPLILAFPETFRGREENVTELELTCRITPQELILSKIMVTGFYNIFLNILLSTLLYFWNPVTVLWKITFMWLVPMLFAGGVTLWFCSRIRGTYSVLVSLVIWVTGTFAFSLQDRAFEALLSIGALPCLLLALFGAALFIAQLTCLRNRYYFERRILDWN